MQGGRTTLRDVAYRLNLFSAVWAALAVALVYPTPRILVRQALPDLASNQLADQRFSGQADQHREGAPGGQARLIVSGDPLAHLGVEQPADEAAGEGGDEPGGDHRAEGAPGDGPGAAHQDPEAGHRADDGRLVAQGPVDPVDRQGRAVWARLSEDDRISMHPRLSWDQSAVLIDQNQFWAQFAFTEGTVEKLTLDGEVVTTWETPGLHHPHQELPDGSLAWGAFLNFYSEALLIRRPDGSLDLSRYMQSDNRFLVPSAHGSDSAASRLERVPVLIFDNAVNMSKHAAEAKGCSDAMFLDYRGYVAEATGANVFFVKDGVIHTPTPDCFLDGITRRTVRYYVQRGLIPHTRIQRSAARQRRAQQMRDRMRQVADREAVIIGVHQFIRPGDGQIQRAMRPNAGFQPGSVIGK